MPPPPQGGIRQAEKEPGKGPAVKSLVQTKTWKGGVPREWEHAASPPDSDPVWADLCLGPRPTVCVLPWTFSKDVLLGTNPACSQGPL